MGVVSAENANRMYEWTHKKVGERLDRINISRQGGVVKNG